LFVLTRARLKNICSKSKPTIYFYIGNNIGSDTIINFSIVINDIFSSCNSAAYDEESFIQIFRSKTLDYLTHFNYTPFIKNIFFGFILLLDALTDYILWFD
jgi:hypothetical protein